MSVVEVFADAALAYQARMSQGETVKGLRITYTRDEMCAFYKSRESELVRLLTSRPLAEICKGNHIGKEGEAVLAKELSRILSRTKSQSLER